MYSSLVDSYGENLEIFELFDWLFAAIPRCAARDATGEGNGNAERDDTWGAEMVTAVNTNTPRTLHEHTGIGFTITGGRVRA